jgi:hypothetical protein
LEVNLPLSKGEHFKSKKFTEHSSQPAKLTKWIEITIRELDKKLKDEAKLGHRKADEEEICPVCRCELYDDLLTMSEDEKVKIQTEMLKGKRSIDVVMFEHCNDHFYHKECVEQMFAANGQDYIRCAICSKIYGVMTGDMPTGTFKWQHHKKG